MEFCVPGDQQTITNSIKLGPGLIKSKESIIACKAGFLRQEPGKMWIDSNQKRYVPNVNEPCIGIVVGKQAEVYKVDIGSAHLASLSIYGFEGARKSNRPNINTGAVLYCRVTLANKDMEPEVECMTADGLAKGFGELKGGYCVKTSLHLARSLFPFEAAVGMNGLVWVNTEHTRQTIALAHTIELADGLDASKIEVLAHIRKQKFLDEM